MHESGLTLEAFSTAIAVLAAPQGEAAPAVGRDGISYRVDGPGPGRTRHIRAGSARRGAQKVWQYDAKIRRSTLHVDRTLDQRPGTGSTALVSRHAARCRIHGVHDSHRRP